MRVLRKKTTKTEVAAIEPATLTVIEPTAVAVTEPPTPYADLTISVGPKQRWGAAATGTATGAQADHLISTFGLLGIAFSVLGSTCAGISGAVLIIRYSGTADLAYAALASGLMSAALIVGFSLLRFSQEARVSQLARPPGSRRHDQ